MKFLNIDFFFDYLFVIIWFFIFLVFVVLGGLFFECFGVFNIVLEGMLLIGVFVSVVVFIVIGNFWIGILVVVFVGGILGLIYSYFCISLKVN